MSLIREGELNQLFEGLRAARDYEGTVPLVLYGDAGFGKTTLLRTFERGLTSDVAAAFGSFSDGAPLVPLQPIGDCVRQLATRFVPTRDPLATKVKTLMGPHDAEGAEQVLQVVGERPWVSESHDIFWALRRFFAACGEAGPVVLLLDDVHRADRYSFEFLTYLGARYAGDLLIACAAEPSLSSQLLAGLSWRTVLLHPLSSLESCHIAEEFLPGALTSSQVERFAVAAGGNPLSLVEGLSLLLDPDPPGSPHGFDDVISLVEEGLPGLVHARLEALDEGSESAAATLAVADQPMTLADLQGLQGSGDEISGHLETLIRRSIVDLGRDHTYRFRHSVIRDVEYQRLPLEVLARLHLRVTEHAHRLVPSSRCDELVALHLEQAADVLADIDPERARDLNDRASALHVPLGEALLDHLDPVLAVPHFQTALELGSNSEVRSAALLGVIHGLMEYGHYAEALDLAERALEDGDHYGAIRDRLLIARYLLHAVGNLPLDLRSTEKALASLIVARQENADPAGEAHGHDALAYVRFLALDGAGLTASWRTCLQVAEREGLRYLAAKSMFQLVQAYAYGPTPVEEGIREALAIAERAPSVRVTGAALMSLAGLYALDGAMDEAEAAFLRAADIFYEVNIPFSLGIGACGVYLMTDDPTPALDYLRGDYFRYQGRAYDWLRSRVCGAMGLVLWELEMREEAIAAAEEARDLSQGKDPHAELFWRAILAKAEAVAGETGTAERHERNLLALLGDCDFLSERSTLMFQIAELRLLLGRRHEAKIAAEEALELALKKGIRVDATRVAKVFERFA